MPWRIGPTHYQLRGTAALDRHGAGRLEEYVVDKRHLATVFRRGACGCDDARFPKRVQSHVCRRGATSSASAPAVGRERRRATGRGGCEGVIVGVTDLETSRGL